MTKETELDLLIDLAKLLKKHGVETFESLAESIKSQEMTDRLAALLTHAAKSARTIPKVGEERKPSEIRPSVPKVLTDLKDADPEKFELLMKLHSELVNGNVLPTIRDVKEFAEQNRLHEIRAKSRRDSTNIIIKSLAELPIDRIKVIIQSLGKYSRGNRSLKGWADIILKRESRSGE